MAENRLGDQPEFKELGSVFNSDSTIDLETVTPEYSAHLREVERSFAERTKKPESTGLLNDPIQDIGAAAIGAAASVKDIGVGIANLTSKGFVGRDLAKLEKDTINPYLKDKLGFSPFDASDRRALYSNKTISQFEDLDKAEGFVDTAKAAIANPRATLAIATESAGPMGLSAGLTKLGLGAATAEALTILGSQSEGIRQQTEDGLLELSQSGAAIATGVLGGLVARGGGAIASKVDAVNPESFLAGKVSKAVDSAGATIAKSGAIEGSEEMLQSGIEQMLSNLALDKPVSEGLGHATALGLLTGSLVGAGVAGASVSSKKHIDPETNSEYQNNKINEALTRAENLIKHKATLKQKGKSTKSVDSRLDATKKDLTALKKEQDDPVNQEVVSALKGIDQKETLTTLKETLLDAVDKENLLSEQFMERGFTETESNTLARNVRDKSFTTTDRQSFLDSMNEAVTLESDMAKDSPDYFTDSVPESDPELTPEILEELQPSQADLEVPDNDISQEEMDNIASESIENEDTREILEPQEERRVSSETRVEFQGPKDRRKAEWRKKAEEVGVTDPDILSKLEPVEVPDDVTGFNPASDKVEAVEAAIEVVRANPDEEAFFVEADISNLGGLNAHFKNNPEPANKVYRQISDIYADELELVSKSTYHIRHGGDEFSTVAIGATQEQVNIASEKAKVRVEELMVKLGLDQIPHPKSTKESPKDPGVGLYFGNSKILEDSNPSTIFEESAKGVDEGKTTIHKTLSNDEAALSKAITNDEVIVFPKNEAMEEVIVVTSEMIDVALQELEALEADGASSSKLRLKEREITRLQKAIREPVGLSPENVLADEGTMFSDDISPTDFDEMYVGEDIDYSVQIGPETVSTEHHTKTIEAVDHIISRINKKNTSIELEDGTLKNLEVKLVESTSNLPDVIQKAGKVKGALDRKTNTIWVVSSSHTSTEEVVKTLAHELIGHLGLRKVLGSNHTALLNNMLDTKGMTSDILKNVSKWGIYLEQWNEKNTISDLSPKDIFKGKSANGETILIPREVALRLADEYMAVIAQEEVFFSRFIEERVGTKTGLRQAKRKQRKRLFEGYLTKVKHQLRKVFGKYSDTLTDDSLREMVAASTDHVFKDTKFDYSKIVNKEDLNAFDKTVQASYVAAEAARVMGAEVSSTSAMIGLTLKKDFGELNKAAHEKKFAELKEAVRQNPLTSSFFALGALQHEKQLKMIESKQSGSLTAIKKLTTEFRNLSENMSDKATAETFLYYTTKDAKVPSITLLPNDKKDARLKELLVTTKQAIDDLGNAFVGLGLLDAGTYLENKGGYLQVQYVKYIRASQGGRFSGSLQDYLKKKDKDLTDLDRELKGQIKDPSYLVTESLMKMSRDIALTQMYNTIFESSKDNDLKWILGKDGIIASGEFTKKGKLEMISLKTLDSRIQHYSDLVHIHEDADKKRAINFSKGAYLLSKAKLEHNLSLKEKMNENVMSEAKVMIEKYSGEPADEASVKAYINKEYKTMPTSKRYGKMSGKIVRKEIYESFFEIDQAHAEINGMFNDGTLYKLHRYFKTVHVALNPPSWFRNGMSNMMLLDTATNTNAATLTSYVFEPLRDIVQGNKNVWVDYGERYGAFGTTMSNSELLSLKSHYDSKIKLSESTTSLHKTYWFFNDKLRSVLDIASNQFGLMEGLFKVAAMRDHVTRWEKQNNTSISKLSPVEKDAILSSGMAFANDKLFDYTKVNSLVGRLRRSPLGAPFLTFMYKSFPVVLENAATRPWKTAKYMALPYLLSMMTAGANDWDEEDMRIYKAKQAEYMSNSSATLYVPWKDEKGEVQVYNMDYISVWAPFFNAFLKATNEGDYSSASSSVMSLGGVAKNIGYETFGFLGGPIPQGIINFLVNKDPFTNKSVYTEGATGSQQLKEVMLHTSHMSLPSWMTDRGVFGKIKDAILERKTYDLRNNEITLSQAVQSGIGLNVKTNRPEDNVSFNLAKITKQRSNMKTAQRKAISEAQRDGGSSEDFAKINRDFADSIKRLNLKTKKMMDEMKRRPQQ